MPEGESIFISSPADGSGIVIEVVSAAGKGTRLKRARPRRGGGPNQSQEGRQEQKEIERSQDRDEL